MDKRFEVSIQFTVKEVKGGQPTAHHDFTLNYSDLPYDGLVATQQVMLEAANKLGDLGIGKAAAMGLGPKLSALGLVPKLAVQAK